MEYASVLIKMISLSEFCQLFLYPFVLGLQLDDPLLVLSLQLLFCLIVLLQHLDRPGSGLFFLLDGLGKSVFQLSYLVLPLIVDLNIPGIMTFL
jgi:hypothetical protein